MWRLGRRIPASAASPTAWANTRQASSSVHRKPAVTPPADEGDWFYSREWWGDKVKGREVFRADSEKGNGVVSVLAYPSSRPGPSHWTSMENWLQQRYIKSHPKCEDSGRFKILGYQWRTLRFNDNTRQSTAKVMAAYRLSDPGFVYIMQQPHCLAVPYLKSMVSAGLTTLECCPYSFGSINEETRPIRILCVGHGGGSLPLFLASKLPGSIVHVVEIDPVVISASIQAMGFPASAVKPASEFSELDLSTNLIWGHIHERLFLYESDAENFLLKESTTYDLIFIDAYDGDDIFPRKLWDPDCPFLDALGRHLHPKHGTVIVNLHSDSDVLSENESDLPLHVLPMGKYVSQVCKAYKETLLGNGGFGLAYTVAVPWLCNISLVVSRGIIHRGDRNAIVNNLCLKAIAVEKALHLPFTCLEYMKRGIALV